MPIAKGGLDRVKKILTVNKGNNAFFGWFYWQNSLLYKNKTPPEALRLIRRGVDRIRL